MRGKGKGCLLLIIVLLVIGALQSLGGNKSNSTTSPAVPDVVAEITARPTSTKLQSGGEITPEPTDWLTVMVNDILDATETSELPIHEELSSGDSGTAVTALQERLSELGYAVGRADGDYGAKTANAIKAVQILAGLEVTGIADDATQEVLWAFDAPTPQPKPTPTLKPTKKPIPEPEPADVGSDYIANKNTKKFHYPGCSSVDQMKESNKWYFTGSRETLIKKGYKPCKRCNP